MALIDSRYTFDLPTFCLALIKNISNAKMYKHERIKKQSTVDRKPRWIS
jgi:hypothetical protein